jgi:hypothetical protein
MAFASRKLVVLALLFGTITSLALPLVWSAEAALIPLIGSPDYRYQYSVVLIAIVSIVLMFGRRQAAACISSGERVEPALPR